MEKDKTKLIVYLNEILSIESAVIKRLLRRMQQTFATELTKDITKSAPGGKRTTE